MPITSTNRVSFGNIPAAREVEPRTNILSTVPQALATTAQREQNAALTSFRAASAVGDVGREVAALGLAFLQPMDKLHQSRKVLEADQVALQTILDGRRMAQTAKVDGTNYRDHSRVVEAEWKRMEANALHKVRHLGPTAVASVSQALGTERIRLFTDSQQYTIGRDVDDQVGMLQQGDTFYRQEITRTLNESERIGIIARHRDIFDTAAQQGIIKASDAEKKKHDFYLYTVKQNALMIGRAGNLYDARTYLRSTDIGADLEREYENAVQDDLTYDLEQADKQEKKLTKIATAAQSHLTAIYTTEINRQNVTPEELAAVEHDALQASKSGKMTGEQAERISQRVASRTEELLNPKPPRDDEATEQRITKLVLKSPESMTPDEIWDAKGLTSETKTRLFNQREQSLRTNHFRNNDHYKRKMAELEVIKTEAVKTRDYFGQREGEVRDESLSSRVEAAQTAYFQAVSEETKATYGVPSPGQIEKLDHLVEGWKKELRNAPGHPQPSPTGATAGDMDALKKRPKIEVQK